MAYACELVDQDARSTLVVRTRTAVERLPEVLGPAWGAIMACAGKAGAEPSDRPFVAYHNADMQDLDLEIGFTFARPVPGEGDVHPGEVPAGKVVQCIHVGTYDRLSEAHDALAAWIEEHGFRPAGPNYEYYVDDPEGTPEDELRTRVVVPVR